METQFRTFQFLPYIKKLQIEIQSASFNACLKGGN